jgi:polysaccharide pyruvyl transferase WcaK-like protein
MNISIFASIGAQNLWDELILKNEIELLKQEFWEMSQFKVASYDIKNPIFHIKNTTYFEYFPLWIKNPRNIIRNIKSFFQFIASIIWSDIVVIGWGGIIYDSEIQSVSNPLWQWIFRVKIARLFRKKIYFYALWIDIKNPENYQKLEKIFKNAYKISLRDKKSQKHLESIGIKSEVVDDPVMNEWYRKWKILGIYASQAFFLKDFEHYDFQGKKIGLALRSWYIGRYQDKRIETWLVSELCECIEKKWGQVLFLPHSFHQTDILANDYIFMKHFLTTEREIYASLWEVYTAYSHKIPDIIITMRLHSIILSYVYGIDQIVLSYSKKTDEVIKKLNI